MERLDNVPNAHLQTGDLMQNVPSRICRVDRWHHRPQRGDQAAQSPPRCVLASEPVPTDPPGFRATSGTARISLLDPPDVW